MRRFRSLDEYSKKKSIFGFKGVGFKDVGFRELMDSGLRLSAFRVR